MRYALLAALVGTFLTGCDETVEAVNPPLHSAECSADDPTALAYEIDFTLQRGWARPMLAYYGRGPLYGTLREMPNGSDRIAVACDDQAVVVFLNHRREPAEILMQVPDGASFGLTDPHGEIDVQMTSEGILVRLPPAKDTEGDIIIGGPVTFAGEVDPATIGAPYFYHPGEQSPVVVGEFVLLGPEHPYFGTSVPSQIVYYY